MVKKIWEGLLAGFFKRQKTCLSVVFIFSVHVATPLRGMKKIYIISKLKANFLKKNPARGLPRIFFTNFWCFQTLKTPLIMRKKNWKNSHVYTCSPTISCENFKIFGPCPSKVRIFESWLFTVILFGLGWKEGGGRGEGQPKNFFE